MPIATSPARAGWDALKRAPTTLATFPEASTDAGHVSALYRIAETSFRVAMRGADLCLSFGNEFEDGVGGALDRAGRAEALADFGKVSAERFAGALVVQQAKDLRGYAAGSEIVLDEFGHGAFSGD